MCGGPFRAILEPILRKFGAVLAAPSRRSRQCPRFHLRLNNCPEPRLNHSATIEPLRGCARSTCILLQRRTVPRHFPNALEPLRGRSRPPRSGSRVVAPQPGRVGGDAEGAATCGRAAPRAQCRAQRARDARPPRVFSDVCPGLGAAAQPPARHLPAVLQSAPRPVPCPPSIAPGIPRPLPPRGAAHFLPPTSPRATCTSQAAPALAPYGPTWRRVRALEVRGQWVAPRRGGAVRGARRHRGRASVADVFTPLAGSAIGHASARRARGGSVARSL